MIEEIATSFEEGNVELDYPVESTALDEYEALIKRFCSSESSSIENVCVWVQYLNFITEESGTRDVSFCRKVYKRAISMCTASIMNGQLKQIQSNQLYNSPGDVLYSHWQNFESRYGNAGDVIQVVCRYRKYRLKVASISPSQSSAYAPVKKRLADEIDHNDNQQVQETKRAKLSAPAPSRNEKHEEVSNNKVANEEEESNGVSCSAAPVQKIVPGKFAIFVKNIAFSVTQQELEQLFKQNKYCSDADCGCIVRLSKNASGKSKGMAHIDFPDSQSVERAMLLHNTELHGRPITVERFVQSAFTTVECDPFTVFVSNMNRKTNESELEKFVLGLFEAQGENFPASTEILRAVKVMKCKRSGNSKVC